MTLSDPEPPVSRSKYSLKANIANGASDPLHIWFYARVFGNSGSNSAICGSIKSQMAADAPSRIYKNGNNFETGLPIDVMFGSRVGFPAEIRFLP